MRILVVGATYMDNFGDMLFSKLVLDRLKGCSEKRFYLTSDYCRRFVGNENLSDFPSKDADALVYMPGGYLGDRSDSSLYTTYLWFKRYFPIGLFYVRQRKPILILAVDAGPCKYWFMRKIIHKICKNAKMVVVRNQESKDFLIDRIHLTNKEIVVTSDYAQTIVDHAIEKYAPLEAWKSSEKRLILLHINECREAREKVLPALKKFYLEHADQYQIVVASDQHYPNDGETYGQVREFAGDNSYYYQYGEDPMELCSVIQSCDSVITHKLHVGIVASAYSKAVIPIPQHYKKVQKYYNQIGCGDRVLPLKDATVEAVWSRISKYVDAPIILSEDIYEMARRNDKILEAFISEVESGVANEK